MTKERSRASSQSTPFGINQEVSRPEAASLINDKHHGPASDPLFAPAHRLGMMGMQSLRYMTDIEYRDAVDAVLEITLGQPDV